MHDKRIAEVEERPGPEASVDLCAQRVVLAQVLALHPAQLTVAELVREIGAGIAEESDRFEGAARDLAGAGLLRFDAGSVLPTRAALLFNALLHEGV